MRSTTNPSPAHGSISVISPRPPELRQRNGRCTGTECVCTAAACEPIRMPGTQRGPAKRTVPTSAAAYTMSRANATVHAVAACARTGSRPTSLSSNRTICTVSRIAPAPPSGHGRNQSFTQAIDGRGGAPRGVDVPLVWGIAAYRRTALA